MGTKNKVPPVGKNKVRAVTQQKAALPHHTSGGRGKKSDYAKELEFKLTDPTGQLPKPTFNVLYVQTPRIGFMQAPWFRAFAETCQEAADLVKPIVRMGIRETSLYDKCPYYDPEFAKGPSGSLIMLRRTRELVNCIRDGSVFEHPPRSVPKGRVYIQDFPNAGTVVFLNLLAYYLITRQSNRLRGA